MESQSIWKKKPYGKAKQKFKETFSCDEGHRNVTLHAFAEIILKTWVESDTYAWNFALQNRSAF